jgi:hypothetical protein
MHRAGEFCHLTVKNASSDSIYFRNAMLESKPSVSDVIRWYRKPSEIPPGVPLSTIADEVSMKYIARIRQKLKQEAAANKS